MMVVQANTACCSQVQCQILLSAGDTVIGCGFLFAIEGAGISKLLAMHFVGQQGG